MLLILSRLALKHDLEMRELQAATFRTLLVKQDDPLMLASKGATGFFCGQIEGGTATSGRAACLWMGGHDDGYDHGPSTPGGRQAESGDTHVQCEFTRESLAEHLLEPVQKHISEGLGKVAVFSGLPDSAHLVPHHQSHEIEGSQREVRPSSSGGQRSRTLTYARRSVMQAGGKGGQQLLTSWIRPKMPSIVQSGTGDRGGQRLLTSWILPKLSSALTVSAALVTAMEYISPAPEVCAATVPVVEISSPTLATSHAETERLFL